MSKREALTPLHCAGRTNSEIIKVTMLWKNLRSLVHLNTVLGVENQALLDQRIWKQRVRRNQKRYARQIAKDMNMNVTSMNHQNLSQTTSLQAEKEIIPHTCPKAKKINRANIFLRYLNSGMAEREIIFLIKITLEWQCN